MIPLLWLGPWVINNMVLYDDIAVSENVREREREREMRDILKK